MSGCTDWALYDLDYFWGYIPALSTLRGSVAFDPYEMPRLPPENAIAVASPEGDVPPTFPGYPYFSQTQLDSVAGTLTNPLQPTPEVLAIGQAQYLNQCAVCHGPQGGGNGPIVGDGKFPFAPAINGTGGVARPAGYVYAIIAVGRGLMPPQGYKLSDPEQWAIATYVQYLQRQADATAAPAAVAPAATDTAAATEAR
jgi:mono/diheme cytochrome c family protein